MILWEYDPGVALVPRLPQERVGGASQPRPLTEPCVRVRTRLIMLNERSMIRVANVVDLLGIF